jgi:ABC-type Mn/Zn transport systems, ATPase component
LAKSDVRTLSGGEFQRVLMARAIACKPELIVLDEPVQGVDFSGEIEIYELIRNIRDELKCGVLLISHDLHVVMAATDRVICLNGHVCCSGTPMTVANSQEYKALFGARALSGLALYEHQHLSDGNVKSKNETIDDESSLDGIEQSDISKHSFEYNKAENHDG